MSEPLRLRTIVAGVDGSERSAEALAFAERLAQSAGAHLVAASVYSSRPPWGRLGSGDAARALARAAATAVAVPCSVRIAPAASPAQGLETVAAEEDADLIVIGSRHRGQLGEALPGDVGHRLLRDPSRPVLFVAPGEPVRALRHIGVLVTGEGSQAAALGERLSAATHSELRIYQRGGGPSAADDLAEGRLDALVVPDWPHGLLGRLRRRGRPARRPVGRCALVVAPPGTA